jgi:hypothetical protein
VFVHLPGRADIDSDDEEEQMFAELFEEEMAAAA